MVNTNNAYQKYERLQGKKLPITQSYSLSVSIQQAIPWFSRLEELRSFPMRSEHHLIIFKQQDKRSFKPY